MKIILPGFEILTEISDGGIEELKHIEKIGRVCYKSEDKITDDGESAKKFVKMLIDRGHEAMIEHSSLSVKFIVDRGISHELVRHRIASFAQESTRFCNYSKDKFNNEITVVAPYFCGKIGDTIDVTEAGAYWEDACELAERYYFKLLDKGISPQEARTVLPTSLKTEVIMTANYREWRSFLKLRTAKDAHPQMRMVTNPLTLELKRRIPVIFDDIEVNEFGIID